MRSACSRPAATRSAARSKLAEVSRPSGGAISRSWRGSSRASERCTFCSVRMLIIWVVTPVTVPSVSRPASGVPMLTAMMRSTPIARATSTGRLSTSPPSPRMRPSTSIGREQAPAPTCSRAAPAPGRRRGRPPPRRSPCRWRPRGRESAGRRSRRLAHRQRVAAQQQLELAARHRADRQHRLSAQALQADLDRRGTRSPPPCGAGPRLSRGSRVENIASKSTRQSSRLQRLGAHAAGVQAADDRAHRGAGDRVDRDALALEHLQHAHMRQAARAAARQHQADARTPERRPDQGVTSGSPPGTPAGICACTAEVSRASTTPSRTRILIRSWAPIVPAPEPPRSEGIGAKIRGIRGVRGVERAGGAAAATPLAQGLAADAAQRLRLHRQPLEGDRGAAVIAQAVVARRAGLQALQRLADRGQLEPFLIGEGQIDLAIGRARAGASSPSCCSTSRACCVRLAPPVCSASESSSACWRASST